MIKKNIKFYFILFCLIVNAQNISVEYSVKINKEQRTSIDDVLDTFKFNLQATEKQCSFKLEETLDIKDELKYSLAKAILVDGYNEYYVNNSNNDITIKKEFLGNFFIIDSKLKPFDWKITKETKKIKNFTCFKATRIIKEVIYNTKEEVDVTITAWFCPEINYSFGPVGNYGLPGLILELNKGRIVYYVNNIQFNDTDLIVEKPKKGKKISNVEFDNMVKEFVDN